MTKPIKKIKCELCGGKRISPYVPCDDCEAIIKELGQEGYIQFIKDRNKKAMAKLGSLGGSVTKARHGKDYFSKMAKASWKKRKQVDKSKQIFSRVKKTQ